MSTLIKSLDVQVKTTPENAFTWVHISDMHFGHGTGNRHRIDQELIADELIRDATELVQQIGSPDALFFTGDVACKADSDMEYPKASKWINRLRDALALTMDKVFIVPGNHDVDRSKVATGFTQRTFHQTLRNNPESLDDLLASPDELKHIWNKMEAFSDFAKPFAAPPLTSTNPFWTVEIETGLGEAVVVGVNTALLSYDDNDSPINLAISKTQIRKSIHRYSKDRMLFILMHHPPDWVNDGEELEAILQAKPHLVLCGHIHKQGGLVQSPLHGHGLLRLVAGAGHVDPKYPPEHSYSWGRLSVNGFEYYPRIWIQGLHKFKADRNTFETMNEEGAVPVTRDRLPPALANWIPSPNPILLAGIVEWLNDPRGQWHLRLEGIIEDFGRERQERILKKVRELSQDVNVTLIAIATGSVSFVFEGSQKKRIGDRQIIVFQANSRLARMQILKA